MVDSVRMALKALLQNRLQALLTLCGMSVGVAMVVIVSGLGRGAQLRIEAQIESAGPTRITVRAGNLRPAAIVTSGEQDTSGGEMTEGAINPDLIGQLDTTGDAAVEDARRRAMTPKATKYRTPPRPLGAAEIDLLSRHVANVRSVAGSIAGNVTLDELSDMRARIARIEGYEIAWPEMVGWKLLRGRVASAEEHRQGAHVIVISDNVANRLAAESEVLGRSVRIQGKTFRVIGVIAAESQDNAILPVLHVPLSTAQALLERSAYDEIHVRAQSVAHTTQVAKDIREALRKLRELPDDTLDDFRVETQSVAALPGMGMDPRLARAAHANAVEFERASWEEMAKSLRQAGRTFTLLLAAAAGVSLLVGGIGIMNIMLVSVAARTREIGLRIAAGARMRDVMRQFLVEAVLLAALGGIIGLVLGAFGLLVARYGLHWSTAVSPIMLTLAVAMAAVTGVIFGYGPARRAASLDPVVALRAE
jgi:putative ABC transport system permease protein